MMVTMQAGILNEIISFLSPITVKDGYGSTNVEYNKVITTRADVKYNNGGRNVVNHEIFNNYGYQFIVRSYHNINEKMIIEWKSNRYRILSIDATEKSKITINTELINE